MTKSDKQQFAKAMTACYMAFDKQQDANQMAIFFDLLSDYDATSVCAAFRKHLTDPDRGRFFPKVADIIYQITGDTKQQAEKLDNQAELDWATILRCASRGAEPTSLQLEALAALRAIGGAHKVGYTLEKEIPFLKREFLATYKAIASASSEQLDESLPLYSLLVSKKNQVVIK